MTSFTIPRNALRAGQIYRATLLVARMVASDETALGAPAISAYFKELHFSVRTLGAPASCGESELTFVFNYPHGALDAGGNPQISFPLGLRYYYALFDIDNAQNLPDKAFFTGPAGSGLNNTESSGFYPHPDGNGAGYGTTSIDTPPFPPGGTYRINLGGEEYVIEMAEPNAANKQVIPVPTVIIDAQRNISEVRWAFKDQQGNPVVRPAWAREIEIRIGPGNGPYYQTRLGPDVTSHVPTLSIAWDSTRMIQVVLYDEHGYHFATYWPPAQPLSIATSSLPPAQVGQSYSVQLDSFGGTFPHTWSLAPGSGAVAPGLGLSSVGGIQG
ncbi:MAG: hypothetical protein Q7R45_09735, partial [Sulfuricaulis sp.]|nr:hypothetical protein [Sulfuricaulis sp.]